MKKIIMACGMAAMMLATVSCDKSGSASKEDKAFGDSLMVALGEANGSHLLAEYLSLPEAERAKFKKDDILRGLKQVLMTDTTQQGFLAGLNFGMQLLGQVNRFEEGGIAVDRNKLYEAYAKAFSADSVDNSAMMEAQGSYQVLAQKAQQKVMEYYQAKEEAARLEKENSPEAKENTAKGEAYLKEQMAKDPEIKVTESGLAYKVINEGSGDAIGKNGTANVKYTGKLIDGTQFDQNQDGVRMTPRQVVPGFGEGLAMMKEGASYILYIPGNLAYGVDGNQQAGIGPNAMLVFEVETSDITSAE